MSELFDLNAMFPPGPCPHCGAPSRANFPCSPCADRLEREDQERELAILRADRVREFLGTVPTGFHWASFASPELAPRVAESAAVAAARKLPASTLFAMFVGPSASGKTSLAVARARASAEKGRSVAFVSARALVAARRETRLGTPIAMLEAAKVADVCLLDGLGEEDVDDPGKHALVELVFRRHEMNRTTFVTCGLQDRQLDARYQDPFVRRLREPSRSHVIACGSWGGP